MDQVTAIEVFECEICDADAVLSTTSPIHYANWSLPGSSKTVAVCSEECKNLAIDQADLNQRRTLLKIKRIDAQRRGVLVKILALFEFSDDSVLTHRVPDKVSEVDRILSRIREELYF